MDTIAKIHKKVSKRINAKIKEMGIEEYDSYFVGHNSWVFWDSDSLNGLNSLKKALAKRGLYWSAFSDDPQEITWAISKKPLTKKDQKLFLDLFQVIIVESVDEVEVDHWKKLGLVSQDEVVLLKKALTDKDEVVLFKGTR